MRKKLYLLSAAGLCIALAFGASVARDRVRDDDRGSRRGLTRVDGRSGSGIQAPVGYSELLMRQRAERSRAVAPPSSLDRAAILLAMAGRTEDPEAALTLLRRALELDLPDTPEGRRLLSSLHYRLADLYEHDRKKAFHLALSSRFAGSEAQRRRLDAQVAALAGARNYFDVLQSPEGTGFQPSAGRATCAQAVPAGALAGGAPFTATNLDLPRGRDRWYSISVAAAGSAGTGVALQARTLSGAPGTQDDDTVLELWAACDGETHSGLIGFADDRGGNAPLMSTLNTGCLAPGTYYLNVRSFDGAEAAAGIDLEIGAQAACAATGPDAFEPDNSRAEATRIGFSSRRARPIQVQAHGDQASAAAAPATSAAQEHSVYPAGDEDWVKFDLKRNSLIRIRTACGFAAGEGNDSGCENPPEFDTNLELYYASETTTFGLCNQTVNPADPPGLIDARSTNACVTDLDCDTDGDGIVYPEDPDDLQNPFPDLPACLPWTVFSTTPVNPVDNPLAFSDDVSFPANLGADMTVCLPVTRKKKSPSLSVQADPAIDFSWYVRTGGWSPDGEISNSDLTFDYALLVESLGDCNFESEPNNDFRAGDDDDDDDGEPNRLTLGESIHGIWDFSATQPVPDHDLYRFDVNEPTAILFEIDGFDPIAVDTFIELVVGPDDNGEFFFTGDSNDDAGVADLRSRMEVFLPPACELLGNCSAGAEGPESEAGSAYYLNVTSAFVVPNFPYELKTSVLESVLGETTDFGDCGSGAEAPLSVGGRYLAGLDDVCDYDAYKFSLDEDAFVRLATGPFGADTVLELRDCDTNEVLACDDDGGPGFQSAMEGCLPGGRDYCVRVRAWDGSRTFGYTIESSGGEACSAEDPPAIAAGGSPVCSAFDTCP